MISEARLLDLTIIANLVASAAHFADNAFRFPRFPEPAWISGPEIVILIWLAITPLLLGGWYFAHRRRLQLARVALQFYAGLSLFVLGHYAYPAPSPMPASMHIGIFFNASAALFLFTVTPAIVRRMRPARRLTNVEADGRFKEG